MTGLWALGSEMLRNIESFWCPIQFKDDVKNNNAVVVFPDIATWAPKDGSIETRCGPSRNIMTASVRTVGGAIRIARANEIPPHHA
jgi:hypothetical protein